MGFYRYLRGKSGVTYLLKYKISKSIKSQNIKSGGNKMNNEIIKQSWQNIKEHIRDAYELSNISYKTWIEDLEAVKTTDHLVVIRIPSDNQFKLTYISKNYSDFFRVTISELLGEEYDVRFILDNEETPSNEKPEPVRSANRVKIEDAHLHPGSNNMFAHSACLAVSESPGNTYNPLFLYGGAGLGKTHLMHSIGHFILEQNHSMRVLYVTSEQFTNEVIESIRSGNSSSMARLRDKYRTVDVLLIDDIQFIIGKESTQEEFFHTFNELHQAGKQIVLSSDRPPKEMETLDERFRSRFEWGLIADIQPPSYETRMAILRKNVENSHFNVDDQVLEYIATNIKSNIRELEGAIKKITAYSRLNNVEITLENAKDALKDMIYPEKNDVVTPERIMSVVCDHYGVKQAAVVSQKKDSEIVVPRQVIMYLCKNYTDITYDAIAKMLGKKDHSTIMHGANKIRNDLADNDELKGNIEVILKKLNVKA